MSTKLSRGYTYFDVESPSDIEEYVYDYILEDSKNNMTLLNDDLNNIEKELDGKLNILDTLPPVSERVKNGFYSQNKDIVRDGIMSYETLISPDMSRKILLPNDKYSLTILTSFPTSKPTPWVLVGVNEPQNPNNWGVTIQSKFEICINLTAGAVVSGTGIFLNPNEKTSITIIQEKAGEITIIANGKSVVVKDNRLIMQQSFRTRNEDGLNQLTYLLYNRALTPSEIKYNFDSMGIDKISDIETAEGRKYEFATKAVNNFFANGMNLERAMNQFVSWKTLQMGADGVFPSSKVADWYSNRYKIAGNTVKNYVFKEIPIRNVKTNSDRSIVVGDKLNELQTTKTYCVRFKIDNLILGTNTDVQLRGIYLTTSDTNKYIPLSNNFTKNGIITYEITIPSDFKKLTDVYFEQTFIDKGGSLTISEFMIYDIEYKDKVKGFFVGLNSVGTTTPDGKTCLSYSVNGVENQFELPQPLRKWDTLQNGTELVGTKEYEITGNENWFEYSSVEPCINFASAFADKDSISNSDCICNLFKKRNPQLETRSTESIYISSGTNRFEISINKAKLSTPDLAGLKAYIKSLKDAGTPLTIQYQLAQPISQSVKSTFSYAPDSTGKASIAITSAVLPTEMTLDVALPVEQVSEAKATLLNSWTETASGITLQYSYLNGRVTIIGDITPPATYNASIFSLPTNLRPTKEMNIMGWSNGVPVMIKIGTDGFVKIPTTVTNPVNINDSFRLEVLA